MKSIAALILSIFTSCFAVYADLPPDLLDAGKNHFARDVNDAGNIVGEGPNGTGALWTRSSASWTTLLPVAGFSYCYANAINNSGKIVGQSRDYSDGSGGHTATSWTGAGAGTDLGSGTCEVKDAFSDAYAVSDSGTVAGTAATVIDGVGCTGPFPAGGARMNMLISNPDQYKGGTTAVDVNDGGVFVGAYPNQTDAGIITGNGVTSSIGFNPKRILNDNTIIGDGFGGGGIKKRSPSGTVESINCGSYVSDANEIGDILTYDFGGALRIWHQGVCYAVNNLLPDDKPGYTFPASGDYSSLNNLGQIAANAFKPGEAGGNFSNTTVVLLTPKYPLAIQVVATPTGTPGEYEFETQTVRGTPTGTTKWEFGDGSAPVNAAVGTKIKKKFTKPGSFSVKATVQDAKGTTAINILKINVPAPTLQIGILVPDFPKLDVPIGADFAINISVSVANDGAGDLSDLTFQGGTFTVSDGSILSFTTAATSPFTLSPGSGNTYPLNVHAANLGPVEIDTLLIGKDAAGQSVSANDSKTIIVKPESEVESAKPNKALIAKIVEAQSLVKGYKEKPSKKNKDAQDKIKDRLKVLSSELVDYLAAHSADISATSAKINLTKLASAAKKTLGKVIKRKATFADDKKAANKALTALLKGIAP